MKQRRWIIHLNLATDRFKCVIYTVFLHIMVATPCQTLKLNFVSTGGIFEVPCCLFVSCRLSVYFIFSVNNRLLLSVSGINFRLLSVNHALISPILNHLVVSVALPPSVPSTDYHHPSSLYCFSPGLKPFFSANPSPVAFLFFVRTDSTDSHDCLPILLSISGFLLCGFSSFRFFSC